VSAISEIHPGCVLVTPEASPDAIAAAVSGAITVQFQAPLPDAVRLALAQALATEPETTLYVYGHHGLRLDGTFGTATDLSALPTMPLLRDLELWQIQRLDHVALLPLGSIKRLRALSLGGLRHVSRLDFIGDAVAERLRYVMLEKLPGLESLAPLETLTELRACGLFEARPADRSPRAASSRT
jgi:hypothetical protein